MKKVLNKLKKVIIIYVITYITLTSMTSSLARGYDAQCGEYAGQWAIDFIDKYASNSSYTQTNLGTINGKSACKWSNGADSRGYGTGTFYGCCTCWVHWIFYYSLGVDINDMGFSPSSDTAYSALRGGNEYFDDVTGQTLQAGDILIVNGHAEMYAGDDKHANFGGTPMNVHTACSRMTPGRSSAGAIAVRLKSSVQVNPAGTVAVDELEDEDLSIYDDNGFIYKGVASIESYESSSTFLSWIINMLSEILDYLIGILTFGIRVVIVGWTAIIERFFIDGIVNAITGVTNKRDETWVADPSTIDDIDEQARADEEVEASEQPELEDIGDQDNPNEYISTGMQQISDIGGNIQLKTSSKANVTIENIVYNKIPILDINFFNFESAGGAVVDEDGVIYIIKENIAMWYYIFRIISILIMLLVLIYLGIKMAITTVSEKKAVYKEMLISWIAGFILVFAVSYIMYAIIHINESFISWIIPEYEDGTELSLYETVRTKAYSLKATTGFTGMIMYIVLVYYSIRFLIVYFKRFLTVIILALMSPFISVAYAIEKVNKNGKSGEIYGNWFKDFLYSVIIQAIHALIYTLFISIILKLTEASILGILISFIFLHFMVRIDKVVRRIFGLDGKNAGKIALGDIKAGKELFRQVKKDTASVKRIGSKYGNYLGKTVGRPFGAVIGKVGDTIDNIRDRINLGDEEIEIDPEEQKKRKKQQEERKERRKEFTEGAIIGAKAGLNLAKTVGLGALVIPALIAEPKMTAEILNSVISSGERTKQLLSEIGDKIKPNTRATTATQGTRYTLGGIQPRSRRAGENIRRRLEALGIEYKLADGRNINGANNTPGAPNPNNTKLTEEQRRELSEKVGTTNLKLIDTNKTIEEVLEETQDITKTEEYAELLGQAHALEKELETSYKEIIGKIDGQIDEAARTVGAEFAIKLQAKKAKELKTTAKIMSQPLSEKDIYRAMQNYKSKVPQFNPTAALSQADMAGITKEINAILEQKGEKIIMTKEFGLKVQKELTESQRKAKEEEERRGNNQFVGQDMTSNNAASSVNVQDVNEMGADGKVRRKSLKERVKEETAPDMSSPYADDNTNAPRQNIPGSEKEKETEEGATERLVKNIVNASKGPEGKQSSEVTPRHLEFAKNLDELRKIGEKIVEVTGKDNEFNLDDIFRRLEAL